MPKVDFFPLLFEEEPQLKLSIEQHVRFQRSVKNNTKNTQPMEYSKQNLVMQLHAMLKPSKCINWKSTPVFSLKAYRTPHGLSKFHFYPRGTCVRTEVT